MLIFYVSLPNPFFLWLPICRNGDGWSLHSISNGHRGWCIFQISISSVPSVFRLSVWSVLTGLWETSKCVINLVVFFFCKLSWCFKPYLLWCSNFLFGYHNTHLGKNFRRFLKKHSFIPFKLKASYILEFLQASVGLIV